nr:hypothetical protein [Tanacetum cinerariifolium]
MLDLKVKPAYQPANEPVIGRKVGRGAQLVNRPLIFHFAGCFVGHWEGCVLYRVRQLKDYAQAATAHYVERESCHAVQPWVAAKAAVRPIVHHIKAHQRNNGT